MPREIAALLVEDVEDDALLLVGELRRNGLALNWERVESEQAMRKALEKPWDVVLCDHRLPGFSSTGALQLIEEAELDLPLLIVSGDIRPEEVSFLMHAGAKDYIHKGDHERLIPAIERELDYVRVRRERREARAAVRRTKAQLRQAQKMESIGRLAGGVAHDFNNLLMIITGYGQMLMADLAAMPKARELVEEIVGAGERAATLTRQLLAFSRKQVLVPRVLCLNDVVSGVQKMLGRIIGEDIELEMRLAPALHPILVDPGQIEQVILNLAVNARDAMVHGGRLLLETRNVAPEAQGLPCCLCETTKESVCLRVEDTGCGMDAATLEKIFDPFFTTKSRERGTGLGLSTVLGIVEQSSGQIRAESKPGVGTVFHICFPRTHKVPSSQHQAPLDPQVVRGQETLLVVEDEEKVRHLLVQILADKGYEVLDVGDGADALELLENSGRKVDLLVTDIVMPRMTGRELGQAVRALHPQMPILYVSGYAEGAIVGEGGLGPGTIFLQKPVMPGKFLRTVRSLLDQPERVPPNALAQVK